MDASPNTNRSAVRFDPSLISSLCEIPPQHHETRFQSQCILKRELMISNYLIDYHYNAFQSRKCPMEVFKFTLKEKVLSIIAIDTHILLDLSDSD